MQFDVLIIGGGPAGMGTALKTASCGLKTALVEERELGGICLNKGCIPTKTLLKCANIYKGVKKAHTYGVEVSDAGINFDKIMERKDKVVSSLRTGLETSLNTLGVKIIKGRAVLIDASTVEVAGEKISAKNIVIATGSRPILPKIEGINSPNILYSDDILNIDKIPESLVIIGGGVIGIEFAYMFNIFGTKVIIIEMQDSILPGFDPDVSQEAAKYFKRGGIDIITRAKVTKIEDGSVTYEHQQESVCVEAEKILVSVGRAPNISGLFSDRISINISKTGIETNENFVTSIPGIFAIGDVNGKHQLAHAAEAQGRLVADIISGKKVYNHKDVIPKCIYIQPEIASVGLTEKQAEEEGLKYEVFKAPVRGNGRGVAEGNLDGFFKIIAEKESHKIIGVHITAPYASEIISIATAVIQEGLTIEKMKDVVFPHPTISEVFQKAIEKSVQ